MFLCLPLRKPNSAFNVANKKEYFLRHIVYFMYIFFFPTAIEHCNIKNRWNINSHSNRMPLLFHAETINRSFSVLLVDQLHMALGNARYLESKKQVSNTFRIFPIQQY